MSSVKDSKYDVVMACEVLEHIPWDDVDSVLSEMYRVCKSHCVVSIPQYGWSFNINFVIPFLDRITKRKSLNIGRFLHRFYSNPNFDGQHYWEVGAKDYSLKGFRLLLKRYFDIEREFEVELNRFHRFYILKKK